MGQINLTARDEVKDGGVKQSFCLTQHLGTARFILTLADNFGLEGELQDVTVGCIWELVGAIT